ncbi:hypothetical protein BKI52_27095 [marine bacterium AO1-C]|nr:hypothetical protein BKI52_27095 [marine bacterium AO1-C]
MTNQVKESTTQLSFPPDLVDTPYILQVVKKSIHYIQSGSFIHFQGPSNSGKTTFARYVACLLQQPVVAINSRIDHPETLQNIWQAASQGYTLIFEEFQNASTNDWQILWPILEENLLNFPLLTPTGKYAHITHPGFTVILTSNTKDSLPPQVPLHLLDNYAIKIALQGFDTESEEAIIQAKSGIDSPTAKVLTQVLRKLRSETTYEGVVSIKLGIMLGRILQAHSISAQQHPTQFQKQCIEVLALPDQAQTQIIVAQIIQQVLNDFIVETAASADVAQQIDQEEEEAPIAAESLIKQAPDDAEQTTPDKPTSEEITIMLHSEVELEMNFFDEVISFIQDISRDEAEVSFHHPGDAVQPDIMIKIPEEQLPQVVSFIEQNIHNEVLLVQKHATDFYECDILIKIPAQVATAASPESTKTVNRQPASTKPISVTPDSKQTTKVQAPSGDEMRIQKLKKLIANYEKFHSQQ